MWSRRSSSRASTEQSVMKHALIIEDHQLIAVMIRDYLEKRGYATVDLASSQGEAIEQAARRCPHLITADDWLEDGSGVEAVIHICRGKAIPVIFLVADPTNVERAIPNALMLLKPFSEDALARAIQKAEATPLVFAEARDSVLKGETRRCSNVCIGAKEHIRRCRPYTRGWP